MQLFKVPPAFRDVRQGSAGSPADRQPHRRLRSRHRPGGREPRVRSANLGPILEIFSQGKTEKRQYINAEKMMTTLLFKKYDNLCFRHLVNMALNNDHYLCTVYIIIFVTCFGHVWNFTESKCCFFVSE
jgi:hypothetical protein